MDASLMLVAVLALTLVGVYGDPRPADAREIAETSDHEAAASPFHDQNQAD